MSISKQIADLTKKSKTLRYLALNSDTSYKKQMEIREEQDKTWKKLQFMKNFEKVSRVK